MTDTTLDQALGYARRGWPVFPCQPGRKVPATTHGYVDATTDEQQITDWFASHPDRNLAIATGTPGPDVLDIDQHGQSGTGYPAFARLRRAGLLHGTSTLVRTPSGGLHAYFTGSAQHNAHLPAHHVDFLARGGYVLAPPSRVDDRPYQILATTGRHGHLDWDAATRLLQPRRQQLPQSHRVPDGDLDGLARWVASQPEGNRNAGLFWAANRALETDTAADLSPLAAAARQVGLGDQEITRTLDSARRTRQARPESPGYQAEVAS